jgi:hypothetical protein
MGRGDCSHGYVEHLRAQHGLNKTDLVAHGKKDAQLRRAAHLYAGGGPARVVLRLG